jgi:hypothetical protein
MDGEVLAAAADAGVMIVAIIALVVIVWLVGRKGE